MDSEIDAAVVSAAQSAVPACRASSDDGARASVERWLQQVVLGLELCPFAAVPWRRGAVRVVISAAQHELALLDELQLELDRLRREPTAQLETTLLALPRLLAEFEPFNQFLDLAEALLEQLGQATAFQIASFHPYYRFADALADDAGNLSNRSPLPVLQLLRQDSVSRVLAAYPDPQAIFQRNIAVLEALSQAERRRLFGEAL